MVDHGDAKITIVQLDRTSLHLIPEDRILPYPNFWAGAKRLLVTQDPIVP